MEKSSLTYDTGDILCKKYVNGHNRYFLVTEQMDTSHIKCIDLDDECGSETVISVSKSKIWTIEKVA